MNATCSDRERIFEDGTPAEWTALEAHAASCPLCAEEVRAWKSLGAAAKELRDYSDSPSFWPRIERALAEEAAQKAQRALKRLGVEVRTGTPVEALDENGVMAAGSRIAAKTVIWSAGVKASPAGQWLKAETEAELPEHAPLSS